MVPGLGTRNALASANGCSELVVGQSEDGASGRVLAIWDVNGETGSAALRRGLRRRLLNDRHWARGCSYVAGVI